MFKSLTMLKKIITLLAFITVATTIWAQAPQQFKFQAVARDADGNPYVNANLAVRVSIVRDGASGLVDFSERHSIISSPLGVFDLAIGNGVALSGVMADLDWGNHAYYLKIDIDPNGGTDYLTLGSSQLLSVPYAIYAGESGSGTGGTDSQTITYNPDTHELSISNGNTVTLPEGGQGAQGEQGLQGETGPQGAPGSQGNPGETGPQGEQGTPGTGINLLGNVTTVGDLPVGAAQGDLYIVQADGNGYAWDGSEWNNVGPIQGPQGNDGQQGEQGEQGIQGMTGPTGALGEQGVQGNLGEAGPQGEQGTQGITGTMGIQGEQGVQGISGSTGSQGIQGLTGPAGTGINLLGNVVTVGDLPAGAAQGDLYIVQADGDGYAWDGSTWNNVGPIQGPQGEIGLTGAQGEQGIQGVQGVVGPMGSQGEQGIQGMTGAIGAQGEIGSQGVAGSQGEQGTSGEMGLQGIPGSAGEQGETGEAGLPGEAGPQGEPGSAGAYTAGAGITIAGDEISATDNSPTNEIQTLELDGLDLSLSDGGGSVALGSLPVNLQLPYYGDGIEVNTLFQILNISPTLPIAIKGVIGNQVGEEVPLTPAGLVGLSYDGGDVNTPMAGVFGASRRLNGIGVEGHSYGTLGVGGLFSAANNNGTALSTNMGKVGFGTRNPTDKVEIMDDTKTRLALNGQNSNGKSSISFQKPDGINRLGWALEADLDHPEFHNFALRYYTNLNESPSLGNTLYKINKFNNSLGDLEFFHQFYGSINTDQSINIGSSSLHTGIATLRLRSRNQVGSTRTMQLLSDYNEESEEMKFEIIYDKSETGEPFELPRTLYKITSDGAVDFHSLRGAVEIDGTNGGLSTGSRLGFKLNPIGEAQHAIHMGAETVDDQAVFSIFETTGISGNFLYSVASDFTYAPEGLGGFHRLFGQTSTNSMVIGELENMDVHALDLLSSRLFINSGEPNIIGATINNNSLIAPALVVKNTEVEGPALYAVGKIGINNPIPIATLGIGQHVLSFNYAVPTIAISGKLEESLINGGALDMGVPGGNQITMSASDDFPQVFIKTASASHGTGQGIIEMQTRQLNVGINPGINTARPYPLRIVQSVWGLNLVNGVDHSKNWELLVRNAGSLGLYFNAQYRGNFDQTSGNYSSTSDARLKTNIRPLPRVLPQLMQLEAKKYEYKSRIGKEYHGFLAQDIQAIFPEVVTKAAAREEGENSTLLVDYAQLTVLSIAAIKELADQIDGLADQVGEQQDIIDQQTSDLEALKIQHQVDMERMNARHQSEMEVINARLEALEGLLLKD